MTPDDRIQAVERLGFSRRQAGFLVAVMSHSGVCLPRQYATFADVAYGHRVNRFFERLAARGFASACPSLHNRALVYHVQHRGLFGAIGEPHSRLRRPVPAAIVGPRLMLLDAVIGAPEVRWLSSAREKADHFTERLRVPAKCLPRQVCRKGDTPFFRLFPDALPVGIEPVERMLFVYPVTPVSLQEFGPFLRRHLACLSAVPAWTLRLVFAPDDRPVEATWQAVIGREIGSLLGSPDRAERRGDWCQLPHRYGHLSPWLGRPIESGSVFTKGHERGNTDLHVLNPLGASARASTAKRERASAYRGLQRTTRGPAWGSGRPALGVRAASCAAQPAPRSGGKGGDGA
jgi:hypothetical protein